MNDRKEAGEDTEKEHTRRYNTKYKGSGMELSLLSLTHRKEVSVQERGRSVNRR